MSVLKRYNDVTSEWEPVVVGKQGPSGVVDVTAPITNTGTSEAAVIGIDESAIEIAPSQVTGTAIVEGDARLTDARTPTAHTHVVAEITDFDPATKQDTITGGASSITNTNLTTLRALVSDGAGKVAVSAVSLTELAYVDGVTSSIQTQLNGKVDKVNGTVTTASTTSTVVRNITLSTADPSGGTDGQVWLKYTV
jgi:hypothetical protein